MRGGKHLLLLAVLVLHTRCQQKPQVFLSPALKNIFSGDLFYLICNNSASGSGVKWYYEDAEKNLTSKTWKISVATSKDSGSYQCESNGQKSDRFTITILEYFPSASLTINTGQPVMQTGGSVVLQLENDNGLKGWNCWVYRGDQTKKIKLRLEEDTVSLVFQPRSLTVLETIFWCTDNAQQRRSNQITIRTSEKAVSLEMYPLPAVAGKSMTLKCLTWGTDQVSHAVFYKDNVVILESDRPTYKISKVTESAMGRYKCDATFMYKARSGGRPYQVVSDYQDMLVHAPTMEAFVSANFGLSCSCPRCPNNASCRWYYKDNDEQWKHTGSSQGFMMPERSGTYACQAVWNNGRSFLSSGVMYQPPMKVNPAVVSIVLVILGLLAAAGAGAFYIWYKKRNATEGPIYEDVMLESQGRSADKFKMTTPRGGDNALHPDVPGREKKVGHYEALKTEGMKEPVYHTLGMEGAGGKGEYEALKKEGMEDGAYHILGMEGAGGKGEYEALKKEGMEDGAYHTLGMEGAGGKGEYEALKKEGMEDGAYHTLGMEGAGGRV
ncbi:uncharacterized protein [Pempheris klunzingeri]|uniref:uncharacterized protein n=1 Tax=Pempheris klunzingeri TaxID=3127111 RepID=UPI0039813125